MLCRDVCDKTGRYGIASRRIPALPSLTANQREVYLTKVIWYFKGIQRLLYRFNFPLTVFKAMRMFPLFRNLLRYVFTYAMSN